MSGEQSNMSGSDHALFARQGDGIDMPAVIGLGAVGGAAEAEKSLRLGIGAKPAILDLLHAGPLEPRGDIARQVEQGVTFARRRTEEIRAVFILRGEAGDEVSAEI